MKYDSATKSLVFYHSYRIDGVMTMTKGVSIGLSGFDEVTRQAIILIAKTSVNFSNGHNLTKETIDRVNKFIEVSSSKKVPAADANNAEKLPSNEAVQTSPIEGPKV